ncbi:tetratricopeptide repeat protein [Kitasatospora sp. NBC_01266]|uniref:tetratricopeptide repeat protein n=1 Tax=Kitasatospora sp. NBC_01266 TaxID=2903572 RepID=UPI002E367057|nr:tetratricopeptide repeat protein [Kitasatospora sp. NBC_01266]
MRTRSNPGPRAALSAAVTAALAVGLFLTGGLGLSPWTGASNDHARPAASGPSGGGDPLAADISTLQDGLRRQPQDPLALATLGLDYVQQARNTADPTYYPKAEEVLQRSLAQQPQDNFAALGGLAALANGRHDFARALDQARRAVAANPYNSSLYGTLADALTQLGRYDEAADAVQRMVDLHPGTPSLARASYVAELRGDTGTARTDMRRALQDAAGPADQAFAHYYLAELAGNSGDPATELKEAEAGLAAAPGYTALLQAKARAEAAQGDTAAALADLGAATRRVPQPEYVLQLGELYQAAGRTREAEQQYQLFRAEQRLLTDNGVAQDSDAALFEADHGSPEQALAIARTGLRTRPFLDSHDALAWALHRTGQDRAALAEADQALAQGTRSALFHFHRAMIQAGLGDTAAERADLGAALAINPHFHPLHAAEATAALAALGGQG